VLCLALGAYTIHIAAKLYELNLYAMSLGRPKERAVSVADELANKRARKAAELAGAAAKRRETWAEKRRVSGLAGSARGGSA
jgi:hypothetical protein